MNLQIQNLYLEHFSKEDLINALKSNTHIDSWAFILHDKDTNSHGLKKAHYHVIIEYSPDTHEQILKCARKEFKDLYERNGNYANGANIVKCASLNASLRYLIHLDNKEKHQYAEEEIITNDIEWLKINMAKKKGSNDMCEEFLNYIDERNAVGDYVTFKEARSWFRSNKMSSFYLTHIRSIQRELDIQKITLGNNDLPINDMARSA